MRSEVQASGEIVRQVGEMAAHGLVGAAAVPVAPEHPVRLDRMPQLDQAAFGIPGQGQRIARWDGIPRCQEAAQVQLPQVEQVLQRLA